MTETFSLFYITGPDLETCQKIGRTLVEEKLAACANILPAMKSIYWWEGKIESNHEAILLLKAPAHNRNKIQSRVEELHSYELPCVLEFGMDSINTAYKNWLSSSLM